MCTELHHNNYVQFRGSLLLKKLKKKNKTSKVYEDANSTLMKCI